ncbi:MAG: CBS domain-containing protein, partial [Anaerolineales bacterium]|nr:CBS domain-containing protein [Anaerolineales bacterium]
AGLFLLVEMNGNVQIVARSTSDSVDVSRVAEHFGGGGHQRAAAALVRERSLVDVREELLGFLPDVIEPPATVGKLMSRGPQLLGPHTTIKDAAERMQRTGHEGYPVVEDDEVLGLLTRRAVDRAMTHGLGNRPVSSVMEAGDVTVEPGDSVEHLQQVMIRSDWGQVPVRDPESGAIVGIVTRTDLLRTLGEGQPLPGEVNLTDELEAALPPLRLKLLGRIAEAAEKRGVALYIVGGFVRDLLLGTPSVDFDLVTEGDAIKLAHTLAEMYGGTVSSHRRFGTAKWQLDLDSKDLSEALDAEKEDLPELPHTLDFVTARSEFYEHPTALPTVERGSIKLDLHRRDFTINTLALRLDGPYYGQLLDHWGGGEDLDRGIVRVLHSLSFVDDPTRMLRAVRLEQRLDFEIESRTMELLLDARGLLDRVSGDRIRSELELIFREPALFSIMSRLDELGLFEAIHPVLTWDEWLEARWADATDMSVPERWELDREPSRDLMYYALWTFRLSTEDAEGVCERLRIPGTGREVILGANRAGSRLAAAVSEAQPSGIVDILEGVPRRALVAVWIALRDDEASRRGIDRYLSEWSTVKPYADGDTLREMGLSPGPIYGRILVRLRDAWLDGEVTSKAEETSLLEDLVEEEQVDG